MDKSSTAAVSTLLYQGVMEPEAWSCALEKMCAALGATVFHSFSLGADRLDLPESVGNIEAAGLRSTCMIEYEQVHATSDLRMATITQLLPGEVFLDHEHISQREMSRNSVYADWLDPLRLKHTAAARTGSEGEVNDFISFMRERDSKPYGAPEKAFLQELMPHLRMATRLRTHSFKLARQAALGLSAVDSLAYGIVLVHTNGRVSYANPAAQARLGGTSPIKVQAEKIECARASDQTKLLRHVANACAGSATAGILRVAGNEPNSGLTVSILPVMAHHSLVSHAQVPMAMLVIRPDHVSANRTAECVAQVLGLSPTESRLAVMLASGKTVKDFAAIEGMSWHTARHHLKNLMGKTGCHRQLELAALLETIRFD